MKKLILIIGTIVLLIFTALVISAHPGKTDSKGGHTDSSTGEYHYHHGYSAHRHYDMDGDGDIDCPYDFDDQTGANSGTSFSNKSTSSNKTIGKTNDNVTVKTETVLKTVTEKVPHIPSWVYWVIGLLIVTVFILICIIKSKREEKSYQEQLLQQKESRIKDDIKNLHQALLNKYGKDYLYQISNAPDEDYVDKDLLPHSAEFRHSPYLDRYTFFLGGNPHNSSVKYHHIGCRYSRSSSPVNAYLLRNRYTYQSCSVCSSLKKLPDTEWVDNYKKHYNFLKQYIDIDNSRDLDEAKDEQDKFSEIPPMYISWRN